MQIAQTSPAASTQTPSIAKTSGAVAQSFLAMALGVFVIGMVGFSHIDVLHNAAHDVRHSNAFPCH